MFQNNLGGNHLDWCLDYFFVSLIFIVSIVGVLLIYWWQREWVYLKLVERTWMEFGWTLIPCLLLVVLGLPSLEALYQTERQAEASLTVKVTGHQWFWSYDYRDFPMVEFDAYLKPIEDLSLGELRLLETDNCVVLPIKTMVRLVLTSIDVLHRWAVPSLRVKVDCNTGRLNVGYVFVSVVGWFYGQCSEICGANHSFMPIKVEGVPLSRFLEWVERF